ncbi:hypothetical protein ACHAWF_011760, partial [Thalassiosira exigua]
TALGGALEALDVATADPPARRRTEHASDERRRGRRGLRRKGHAGVAAPAICVTRSPPSREGKAAISLGGFGGSNRKRATGAADDSPVSAEDRELVPQRLRGQRGAGSVGALVEAPRAGLDGPPPPSVPDAFLRFLLLVARVPLVAEDRARPLSPPPSPRKQAASTRPASPSKERKANGPRRKASPVATAAAERAFDLYRTARFSYEAIAEGRRRAEARPPPGGGTSDAAASFFAACSGEAAAGAGAGGADVANDDEGPAMGGVPDKDDVASITSTARAATMASATTAATATSPLTAASVTASSVASSASAVFSNVLIDREMLGLTVENVLERTIIRTLLPDGAAKRAGARVGSLIAKVGNVDTSNLTHFETIDELRRCQRPLRLTLRHVGNDVLRRAREEMGRLVRGWGAVAGGSGGDGGSGEASAGARPWREGARRGGGGDDGETFDAALRGRWPSRGDAANNGAAVTRSQAMRRAGRDLIRILALLAVGLERELADLRRETFDVDEGRSNGSRHPLEKELVEALEITSKILLDYARGLPEMEERTPPRSGGGPNAWGGASPPPRPGSSSFYPVPPGRVQGKKAGGAAPPPGRGAGRGGRGGRGDGKKASKDDSPLLRIGDALSRARSFLAEASSSAATALRWEVIDFLCVVLDLDTEQELSEQESASSSAGGGEASGMNDLGSAGSILKLIVLNCSTGDGDGDGDSDTTQQEREKHHQDGDDVAPEDQGDDESDEGEPSVVRTTNVHNAGNPFLSVVHRLAASKSTSARVSACSLGPVLWSHLDFPRQLQLRGVITRSLHDVEVTVRRSTATVLHEIAELVFDRRAVPWLVLMCERSMTDPEPRLRAAAMTLTWHLAEHLPNAFLGDARHGSRSIRRLPPRSSSTFLDVYLLQCKLLPVATALAEDRVASVRLSVAAQCDRLCRAMGEHWFSVIIDLLQALLADADERVRSEAILCMPRLVEAVVVGTSDGEEDDGAAGGDGRREIAVLESLLPAALKIQRDASPLVRGSLATATGELLIFLVGLGGEGGGDAGGSAGNEHPSSPRRMGSAGSSHDDDGSHRRHSKHVDDTLIPILQRLLQDSDPEVTTASLRAVTNASRSGARDTASTHIPSCSHRRSLSTNIDDDLVSLSSIQSHTSTERTRPVFIPVLSESQVLRLLPTLSGLATSAQWRVRQSAVEIVPALMGCTSSRETRHEISKLCLRLMGDRVDAVRKTAAECLCLGGSSLARHGVDDGGEWIRGIVIPHLKTCGRSPDSKQRLLSLKMVEIVIANGLCPADGPVVAKSSAGAADAAPPSPGTPRDDESITTCGSSVQSAAETPLRAMLDVAASRSSDPVPNVRLNVGRTFGAVLPLLHRPEDVDFVVSALERQLEEEKGRPGGGDRDVIYFARWALELAEPMVRRASSRDGPWAAIAASCDL